MGMLGYFVWMAIIVLSFIELTRLMKMPGTDPALADIHKWAPLHSSGDVRIPGRSLPPVCRTYTVTLLCAGGHVPLPGEHRASPGIACW